MIIGDRLRELRETKKLSQGDIEHRTGLLRCYVSRVENGHTVPSIETLEKMSRALEVPMYQLFYDGEELPKTPIFPPDRNDDWASQGKGQRVFMKLCGALSRAGESDRKLLLSMARMISRPNR